MEPRPGWYADPLDPKHSIRYWDGSAWVGESTLRTGVRVGESMQRTGSALSSFGSGITWVVLGIGALLLVGLIIT